MPRATEVARDKCDIIRVQSLLEKERERRKREKRAQGSNDYIRHDTSCISNMKNLLIDFTKFVSHKSYLKARKVFLK